MEEQRYAIVTGGNRGIGLEICRQLASNGVQVILTSRNQTHGEEAVKKLNVSGLSNVISHQLDFNDSHSIASLAKFVQTRFGKLDILVNNAAELGIIILDEKEFRDGGGFFQKVEAELKKEWEARKNMEARLEQFEQERERERSERDQERERERAEQERERAERERERANDAEWKKKMEEMMKKFG